MLELDPLSGRLAHFRAATVRFLRRDRKRPSAGPENRRGLRLSRYRRARTLTERKIRPDVPSVYEHSRAIPQLPYRRAAQSTTTAESRATLDRRFRDRAGASVGKVVMGNNRAHGRYDCADDADQRQTGQ